MAAHPKYKPLTVMYLCIVIRHYLHVVLLSHYRKDANANQHNDGISMDDNRLIPNTNEVVVTIAGSAKVLPGSTVTYSVRIWNKGSDDDHFEVSTSDELNWADLSAVPTSVDLSGGSSYQFEINVYVPHDATRGITNITSVSATGLAADSAHGYTIII